MSIRQYIDTRNIEGGNKDQLADNRKTGEAARKLDSPDICGCGTSLGSLIASVWGHATEKGRRWLTKEVNQEA